MSLISFQAHGTDGIDGGDASLAPTGFRAMGRNELQWLCKQKGFKANVSNKSMSAALQASMCSDMTATGVVGALQMMVVMV